MSSAGAEKIDRFSSVQSESASGDTRVVRAWRWGHPFRVAEPCCFFSKADESIRRQTSTVHPPFSGLRVSLIGNSDDRGPLQRTYQKTQNCAMTPITLPVHRRFISTECCEDAILDGVLWRQGLKAPGLQRRCGRVQNRCRLTILAFLKQSVDYTIAYSYPNRQKRAASVHSTHDPSSPAARAAPLMRATARKAGSCPCSQQSSHSRPGS